MMWFLLLLFIAHIEPVILQGEKRLILRNGNNPCEGHVEIYYDNKWGYVGDKYWSRNTEEVVCRSTHCGSPVVNSTTEIVIRPTDSKVWLNEVKCKGNESHLWECEYPGWGISHYQKDTVKKVKCTNQIKISLDGFKCAGAVQYFTDGKTHSGYFCADIWREEDANFLCKSLGCGTSKEIVQQPWMGWKRFQSSKKMAIKCSGIENITNLWQCATEESTPCQNPASVICTGYERLQLKGNTNVCSGQLEIEENGNWNPVKDRETSPDVWCQQMHCGASVSHSQSDNGINLTCTDKVKVVLMDNGKSSKCYGAVHIEVNALSQPVCASSWTEENAQVVCRELNCGNVVSKGARSTKTGIMDYVTCSGKESSLWHCRAKRDKNAFQCASIAYVVCADSMEVRLMDGPGKCAGRVEIQHEGQWKRVDKKGWTDTNSHVVCRQLNCGNKRNDITPEKFSQGSGDFLDKTVNCKSNALNISECITDNSNKPPAGTEAMGITCEEHKVVFLNNSCSGMVGIEHGPKTYWLSGSKKTWNQESANTVCQQVQCGDASPPDFIKADVMKDVWNESYSCSFNTTSLFECEKTTLPSDYNDTIATVTCSGKIEVNLTNECWGHVNVCVNGKCGGVCADTWTHQKSVMLCKDLGCGDPIHHANNLPNKREVIFKSLHSTMQTTSLNQCNFVASDDDTCNRNPAYVVCSGSIMSKFNASSDKCSGNVALYYAGKWLPVCMDALKDIKTQNTICGELKCGQAVKNIEFFGPKSEEGHVISQIQCSGNGKESLTACNITSDKRFCNLGGLQCSLWSKMALKVNSACSGDVFVHSEGKISAVSADSWTKTEGERLCQDLKCGRFKSSKTNTWDTYWNRRFSCAGVENPENIWDCENQTSPSQKQQLFIECEDEPNVTLSETCHGDVKINNIEVCDTHWNNNYSHLVCQERNCSNAIGDIFSGRQPSPHEEYLHVMCEDYHYTLGQCKRFKGTCKGKLVSIYCIGNIKFKTTERCGGQIEVNYRNSWEKMCPLSPYMKILKEKLCEKVGCPGLIPSIKTTNKNEKVNLKTQLFCTRDHMDINHCVFQESCQGVKPAEIYCEGYAITPINPKTEPQVPIVPIMLGVGLLLILVILTVVFIRICIVKKSKKAKIVSSRMMSNTEFEFESDGYEDVMSKANEMEDFGRDRFRSEAEVIMESDTRSNASLSYDDIDEAAEARPLTSQAATAGASGDNYIHEGALDQSTEGVTYEVDDPHENYDDIEACPEIAQTKVEVHYSPQTTPERVATEPPGLVQGDENYLVPGQDG